MQYTVYPTCYHETLSDLELERRECSDGIYVSVEQFGALMADSDEMIVYRLRHGEREAYVHISGTHQGERYVVMAPPWVCGLLGCGDELVTVERAYPGIGSRIKIRPHSTEYTQADDPVEALQRAFEAYSCIAPGMELPLMVNGRQLVVDVLETNGGGPICIRGVELEVEIQGEVVAAEPEAEAANFDEPMFAAPVHNPRFPGVGRRLS
jgi:hypothetical protein